MPTRAAIYCRISSDRDDSQLGVDRQEKDCRRLCKDRGWKVANTYVDNDMSAADPKTVRPEYQRLLRDITAKRVDAVVVWDADRLHRQPMELEEFVKACVAAGMKQVASVGGDTNLNDPDALMILRLKGVIAAAEVAKSRRRIQRKKLELAERGVYSGGGTRPFGYEADGITINEVEAALIREAAQRVIEGATMYSIRKDWDARGVSTVKGNPWTTTSLKSTLTRPRVAGLRQHQGQVIGEAQWPAILDMATWEQVRAILLDPSRRQPPPSRDYPLRGVLKCAECGAYLASIPREGNRHYGCKKDSGGCGHVWISAHNVENYVFGIMVPLADSQELRNALRADDADIRDQASALVNANSDDEKMLAQIAADYADRLMDRPAYLKQSARLRERIEARGGELSALRGQSALDRLGGEVASSWAIMSADDKRLITLSLMESIEVSKPARKGGNVFDVQRLNIQWRPAIVAGRNQYFGVYNGKAALLQFGVSGPVPVSDGQSITLATQLPPRWRPR